MKPQLDEVDMSHDSVTALTCRTAAITAEALTAASSRAALAVGLVEDMEIETWTGSHQARMLASANLIAGPRISTHARHVWVTRSVPAPYRSNIASHADGSGPSVRQLASRLSAHASECVCCEGCRCCSLQRLSGAHSNKHCKSNSLYRLHASTFDSSNWGSRR